MKCWLRNDRRDQWLDFSGSARTLVACSIEEVLPLLAEVEAWTNGGGWAAGFLSYEAAPAFDPALVVQRGEQPLAWFCLCEEPQPLVPPGRLPGTLAVRPRWDAFSYESAFAQVQTLLHEGETYQVNLTFPLEVEGETADFWMRCREARFGAWIVTDDMEILSASPEGFLGWEDGQIWSEPMKGTRPTPEIEDLACSAKDRAENLMIVDMIRNDLGRVCEAGSVCVPELFRIEAHPTVAQMTSLIRGRTSVGFRELLMATFPCASISGAPKVRTMQIIRDLEPAPRGLYTGAIGWVGPGCGQFSVAIRTLVRHHGECVYGVGSGVVVDSDAQKEYDECLLKSKILTSPPAWSCSLIETIGASPAELHLDRMEASAHALGFPWDRNRAHAMISGPGRLLLDPRGELSWHPLVLPPLNQPVRLSLAPYAVDSSDLFLRHKTTVRGVYEQFPRGDADEIILWNERGELTETPRFNIVLELDGELVTPALKSGLLPGVMRQQLGLREATLYREDLARATALFVMNSVRGFLPAVLLSPVSG